MNTSKNNINHEFHKLAQILKSNRSLEFVLICEIRGKKIIIVRFADKYIRSLKYVF